MEIRKIEMCIRRSPYFYNFQNKKNLKKKLFQFHSAIWSNPYTRPLADPCFLKQLTCAHTLPEVMEIVVNRRSSEMQGTALAKCLQAWPVYTGPSMPAGVAQSSHAFVGGTVSTWAR